ncbi:MAG TPA: cytochrome c biogenesis protein CcsA [Gemmatimonadales bacterium]|nr:cytochrome c biogenesis protein CcsA [Gemmatimonadales bacterium]
MTADLASARRVMIRGAVLTVLGLLGVGLVMVLALAYTPEEINQGLAQKIFYIHAPSAWAAMLSVVLTGLASMLYLWLHDPRIDRFAASSAEVGSIFCGVVLTTGPIWGKPIWGTWWTWDGRLTLTLFLFFLLLGYHTLRAAIREPFERGRFSAVLGIMGMVLVPFIHLSVYLWRGLHPMPIVLKPSAPSLDPQMLRTLLISFGVMTLLYVGFVTLRYGIQLAHDAREAADAS